MSASRRLAGLFIAATVTACAGSVAPPVVVTPLAIEQRTNLHLAAVSTEAAQGVAATAVATARINQLILADLQTVAPGLLDPAAPQARTMRVLITRYDEGDAGARFLIAGLGQIRLEGTVTIQDAASRQTIAEYKVEKQFSFGGLYGALTTIQDVEKGFAKSVVALVAPPT